MTHILHLDSSPRGDRSISRALTKEFITAWKQIHPNDQVTYCNLGRYLVPPIDESWIAAAFSLTEQLTPELAGVLNISNELIDELEAAQLYVFGIPMYNYSVPANFKAYIDQNVRVRRTFAIDSNGYKGLVKDKKMVVITTRGSSYSAGPLDFQEPYLGAIFEFIGITDIKFIHAENLSMGSEERQYSIAEARAAIEQFIANYHIKAVFKDRAGLLVTNSCKKNRQASWHNSDDSYPTREDKKACLFFKEQSVNSTCSKVWSA